MTSAILFPELAEPQIGFDFPQPLSEKYRPRRIADFAGLTEPKKVLDAAGRPVSHWEPGRNTGVFEENNPSPSCV